MKIKFIPQSRAKGFVLVMVMIICAVSLMILAGTMYRAMTVARLNQRSNQLFLCRNMAEAATEKVYAQMAYDFLNFSSGQVNTNLNSYRTDIPSAADNGYFTNFIYSDGTSNGCTYVSFLTNYTGQMPTQYSNSYVATSPIYRIMSNVRMANSLASDVVGTAQEDVLLAEVPITTYAIFYNGELEFSDCATMLISGRTHANSDICTGAGSGSTLTFNGAVTCCTVIQSPKRGGITYSFNQSTTYKAGCSTNVTSVQISIPMTNTHSIIEIPPATESTASALGKERRFNLAQVVLIVTNSPSGGTNPAVYLTLQNAFNGLPANDPSKLSIVLTNVTTTMLLTNANNYYGNGNPSNSIALPFLCLTNTFTDLRENQSGMFVSQIDIGAFGIWITNNPIVAGKISSGAHLYPTILYVADQRAVGTSKLAVVRLVNGQQLPANNGNGFSVVTQNPLYIKGNYNVTQDKGAHNALTVGSTTNGWSVPAALIADSLTVLSPNWDDSKSGGSLNSRNAASMTMNAAVVVGNVPSTGTDASSFSGGVHNLTRLLEDWTGDTLTYNTSIVCLFSSTMATHQFQMPGAYYNAPTRNWGFDLTYYSPDKQPPAVPNALVPIRFNWTLPPPNTVSTN